MRCNADISGKRGNKADKRYGSVCRKCYEYFVPKKFRLKPEPRKRCR